ncbi:hypothetical protein [Streptomyces coelicoflavus]
MNVPCVAFVVFVVSKVPKTGNRSFESVERALRAPGSLRRNPTARS